MVPALLSSGSSEWLSVLHNCRLLSLNFEQRLVDLAEMIIANVDEHMSIGLNQPVPDISMFAFVLWIFFIAVRTALVKFAF
jgi:hypothetical protein